MALLRCNAGLVAMSRVNSMPSLAAALHGKWPMGPSLVLGIWCLAFAVQAD